MDPSYFNELGKFFGDLIVFIITVVAIIALAIGILIGIMIFAPKIALAIIAVIAVIGIMAWVIKGQ